MKARPKKIGLRGAGLTVGGIVVVVVFLASAAFAEVGGLSVSWWTLNGGGASSGGSFTVSGTAGQPEAGSLSGGTFTVGGGFWAGAATTQQYNVYLPAVLKSYQ